MYIYIYEWIDIIIISYIHTANTAWSGTAGAGSNEQMGQGGRPQRRRCYAYCRRVVAAAGRRWQVRPHCLFKTPAYADAP